MKIPSFKGNSDLETYLEWKKRLNGSLIVITTLNKKQGKTHCY